MIREARQRFAEAIEARAPDVEVYLDRPDTAAGPAVWIELDTVTWAQNVCSVNLRAVCVAVEGREPTSGGVELDRLADIALSAAIAAGASRGTLARPSTRTFGDIAWPAVEVTAQMVANHCDLPKPLAHARSNGGS